MEWKWMLVNSKNIKKSGYAKQRSVSNSTNFANVVNGGAFSIRFHVTQWATAHSRYANFVHKKIIIWRSILHRPSYRIFFLLARAAYRNVQFRRAPAWLISHHHRHRENSLFNLLLLFLIISPRAKWVRLTVVRIVFDQMLVFVFFLLLYGNGNNESAQLFVCGTCGSWLHSFGFITSIWVSGIPMSTGSQPHRHQTSYSNLKSDEDQTHFIFDVA